MEERLQKVLARAGVASRRAAEKLIEAGRVQVNGRVVREMGVKVDPALDEVRVDTVPISAAKAAGHGRRTYLLLNKPKGVLCTVKDPHGRPTVLDVVPPKPGKRLYPVGRLDEDSEGLVLLTNDGDLTERLTHPRYGVPKVYDVRLKGRLTPEAARKFEAGVWLSDGKTGRSRVRIRRAGPRVSHAVVTLTEGKNREIRRAFAKLEYPVLSVRRVQIGPIVGRGLRVGEYRPLDPAEVEALHDSAAGRRDGRPLRRPRKTESGGRRRSGKPDPARANKAQTGGRKRGSQTGQTGGPAKRKRPGPRSSSRPGPRSGTGHAKPARRPGSKPRKNRKAKR